MGERLNELNSQFKKIKTDKNTQPKKKTSNFINKLDYFFILYLVLKGK